MKRLISFLLVIAVMLTLCPNALAAKVESIEEIAAVIELVPIELRGEVSDLLEEFPSMSVIDNSKNWAEEVNPLFKTGAHTNGVYQCFGFAMYVYARLFGVYAGGSKLDFTQDKCSVKLLQGAETADYESFVAAGVKSGAHIRTTEDFEGLEDPNDSGHSMILLTYNEEHIYIYHGNADGKGTVRVDKYTWEEFNKYQLAGYYTPRRIKYIAVPLEEYYPKEDLSGDASELPVPEIPEIPEEEEKPKEDTRPPEEKFSDRNPGEITVYIDGVKQKYEVEPKIINGRTMVPFRGIFESLGAYVGWDDELRIAYGKTDTRLVQIGIGNDFLLKNNEPVELDSPAMIDAPSGRTLVPARAIAESLECKVEWHNDLRVVEIVTLESTDPDIMVIGYYEEEPYCYNDRFDGFCGFDVELSEYICEKLDAVPLFVSFGEKNALNLTGDKIADFHLGVPNTVENRNRYNMSYTYRKAGGESICICFAKDNPLTKLVNREMLNASNEDVIRKLQKKYGV